MRLILISVLLACGCAAQATACVLTPASTPDGGAHVCIIQDGSTQFR